MLNIQPDLNALINLPGLHLWIKDTSLSFAYVNQAVSEMIGFDSVMHAIGKSDYEIPSSFVNFADIFRENDFLVMRSLKTHKFLEIQQCAITQEMKILFVTKVPYFFNGKVCGVAGYSIDISKSFIKLEALLKHKHHSHRVLRDEYVEGKKNYPHLTIRETECLFLLLRGKTVAEVAKTLGISTRTSESHCIRLKEKFGCQSKSQLIDAAIMQGYLNMVPESIFNKPLSLLIE